VHVGGHHGGVASIARELVVQRTVGDVFQVTRERGHIAIDHGMLVDFTARAPTATAAVEQAQHAVGIGVAVPKERAEIFGAAREAEAGEVIESALARRFDGRAQCGRDAFIGVEAEHPFMARLPHCEILLRTKPLERVLDDARAMGGGDFAGAVGGTRIDHHHLVAERQRVEARRDAIGFVQGDHAGSELRRVGGRHGMCAASEATVPNQG
jgi:hypothetical protein